MPERRPAKLPGLATAQRLGLLAALVRTGGFEAACLEAGISQAAALAERARDPLFALEWDRLRLAQVQVLLLDKAVAGLGGSPGTDARTSEARDKYLIALGQWLLESKGTPPEPKRGRAAASVAAEPKPPAVDDTARIAALIQRAEARLIAAEALLGDGG